MAKLARSHQATARRMDITREAINFCRQTDPLKTWSLEELREVYYDIAGDADKVHPTTFSKYISSFVGGELTYKGKNKYVVSRGPEEPAEPVNGFLFKDSERLEALEKKIKGLECELDREVEGRKSIIEKNKELRLLVRNLCGMIRIAIDNEVIEAELVIESFPGLFLGQE